MYTGRSRVLALVSVALGVSAAQLLAQTDSVRLAHAFRGVPAETELELRLTTGQPLLGRFRGTGAQSILLQDRWSGTGERRVPVADITSVWAQQGTQMGKGALLGAGIGVGAGLLLALAVGGSGDLEQGQVALAAGGTFGLIGAVAGFVVGGLTERWRRIRLPTVGSDFDTPRRSSAGR
jgi:hypothetical protein